MAAPTRYAKAGDVHIAWTELGSGPIDLIFCSAYISHVEHMLRHPAPATFFEALGRFCRVILFDRRGAGLSDRIVLAPTLEEQMEDVIAVMDAAGSERAALIGFVAGTQLAVTAAATYPDRCAALILLCGFARTAWAPDYDWATRPEDRPALASRQTDRWGDGARAAMLFPDRRSDEAFLNWFGELERLSSGPGDAQHLFALIDEVDVRHVLPSVHAPTLVMHPAEPSWLDSRHAQYLADHIPGARLATYPGSDAIPIERAARETVVGEIEELLTGARGAAVVDRALATVLFTDIVDSTARAARVGDDAWACTLETHVQLVIGYLLRFKVLIIM
jgi:pimeloyl-ACP methyl ester carboxylesterase